jgi:crossover junction endodeoxyribonuclease RuvC
MGTGITTRILGLDPGTLRLGFGLVASNGTAAELATSGVLTAPAAWEPSRRLGHLAAELTALLDRERPDCIALEASFFGKNAHSLIRLGEARGMVLALAGGRGLAVHDYPPATVKKSVVGHGGASKEQVARMVAALFPGLGARRLEQSLDQTDAIAIAWCHVHQQRLAERRSAIGLALEKERRVGR